MFHHYNIVKNTMISNSPRWLTLQHWLVRWLVGWVVSRSVGRLVGWSVGRLVWWMFIVENVVCASYGNCYFIKWFMTLWAIAHNFMPQLHVGRNANYKHQHKYIKLRICQKLVWFFGSSHTETSNWTAVHFSETDMNTHKESNYSAGQKF